MEAHNSFKKRLTDGGFLVPLSFQTELQTLAKESGMDILGFKFRDKVTGFEGVATGYVRYLSGCNQALIVPHADKNEFKDGQWIDEQRLKRRPGKRVILDNTKADGFDRPAPKR